MLQPPRKDVVVRRRAVRILLAAEEVQRQKGVTSRIGNASVNGHNQSKRNESGPRGEVRVIDRRSTARRINRLADQNGLLEERIR